jgi:hypothetical protein
MQYVFSPQGVSLKAGQLAVLHSERCDTSPSQRLGARARWSLGGTIESLLCYVSARSVP